MIGCARLSILVVVGEVVIAERRRVVVGALLLNMACAGGERKGRKVWR